METQTTADRIQVGNVIKWNQTYLWPVIMTEPRGQHMTAIYTQRCKNDIVYVRVINNTRTLTIKGTNQ